MTRYEIYLEVLAEKTGQPKERLLLVLDRVKERLQDDLSDEIAPEEEEFLRERLRKLPLHQLEGTSHH